MQPVEETEMEENLRLEGIHYDVIEATLKSFATKSITPIVKEELKLKIQASRLAAGKTELPTPVFIEPQKCSLTKEEEEKRNVKRERNRVAAEKCRKKKKEQKDTSVQELEKLQHKNKELKALLASLEGERSDFINKLVGAGFNISGLSTRDEPGYMSIPSTPLPSTSTDIVPPMFVPTTVHDFTGLPSPVPATCINEFNDWRPQPTTYPQTPSGYTEMTSSPHPLSSSQRRASYDVINNAKPVAPPYRRYSADPYISVPSTSTTAWSDMPQQLCDGGQQVNTKDDIYDKLFDSEVDFVGFSQLGNDIDMLLTDDEEALVPGHNFENIRESPSFY